MTALPIEGYAREYTDAKQLLADIAARRATKQPIVVNTWDMSATVPEPDTAGDGPIDIPDFLATRERATEWLDSAPASAFRPSDATIILRLVCRQFNVSFGDLKSVRRTKTVIRPRMIACWLMRNCTALSLPIIGRKLGDRDHTTILHAVRSIDALRLEDKEVSELTDMLRAKAEEEIIIARKMDLSEP